MVQERLELPKMRKKQQKQTVKIAFDQVKKSAIEECLPNGVKKFPDEFFEQDLQEKDFEIYPTSGKPLHHEYLLGSYTVLDETKQEIFATDSELKADFALIIAKQDMYILRIPKDEKIISKAIKRYIYTKELKEQLETNAHQKTHDWAAAERIAKEIMDEYSVNMNE